MNLNDLQSLVTKSAPLLGSLLGGPLAGLGVSWLAHAFGVDGNHPQDIINKILADPQAALTLKSLEYNHQEELQRIQATNYQTEVDDRKSARVREISLHDYVPTILAIGFLINYACIQFYCVTHSSSATDIISARFQDVLIMIISYYFGSSHKKIES